MNVKKISSLFAITCLALFLASSASAQFEISNTDKLSKLKGGTTYILMRDPEAPEAQPYIEVFKQFWTFSKPEFIKYAQVDKYLGNGNSFFSIGGYSTTAFFGKPNDPIGGMSYTNTHLYLELWTPEEGFVKKAAKSKKKQELKEKDKTQYARIELYTDFETLAMPDNIYRKHFDGGGHIRNWGPGVLKNYLQHLMAQLDKGDKQSLYAISSDDKKLKALQKQVLYVPDFALIKFNKFTGDESKRLDEKEIFGDYKFNYELLTIGQLNEKIMTGEQFYYMMYLKSSTDKYINVIDAQTGEVIYANYAPMSYNISEKDLKKLYEAVK